MDFCATEIGYCSNVHGGETVAEIKENFTRYIQPVCQQRGLAMMESGLWISAIAAEELRDEQTLASFKLSLIQSNLQLTSINGFPYGGFHQQKVKAQVYLPDWSDTARLQYSKNLAVLLAECLPEYVETGVISTLPLGYKKGWNAQKQQTAITHLAELTDFLDQLKKQTGKGILFCFEMEPDCVLESTDELLDFFVNQLRPNVKFNSYLAVCYDVCHQAVMFEDAYHAMQRIVDADITIGKIQLSSALQIKYCDKTVNDEGDDHLLRLLRQFCEPKYLHQVKCKSSEGELLHSADLSIALNNKQLRGDWRIHFHVPINTDHLVDPRLKTTRDDLLQVFDFLRDNAFIRPCLEVETYSWQVLPVGIRPKDDDDLITGITEELRWVEAELLQRELLQA